MDVLNGVITQISRDFTCNTFLEILYLVHCGSVTRPTYQLKHAVGSGQPKIDGSIVSMDEMFSVGTSGLNVVLVSCLALGSGCELSLLISDSDQNVLSMVESTGLSSDSSS